MKTRGVARFSPLAAAEARSRRRRSRTAPGIATLRDVASIAGVSTASASRALARPDMVSDALRVRVIEAAGAISYTANAAARTLSSKRPALIGLIIKGLGDPIVGHALASLEWRLAREGLGVLLATPTTSRTADQCYRQLLAQGAGAIGFVGLAAAGVSDARTRQYAINLDFGQRAATALAVRYLFELGHRRMAALADAGFDPTDSVRATLGALGMKGINVPRNLSDPKDTASALVARLQALESAPTALICASDTLAAGVLRACVAHGVAVPRALSVIGLGDSEIARHTRPALTSVRIDPSQAGETAAEALLAALAGRAAPEATLQVKLVLRGSCVAPGGAGCSATGGFT